MDEGERFKILVVDDETSNIDALYGILKPLYDVYVAKNGETAIKRAMKHMPDLILLDIILPDMTGFEIIHILKESEITRHTPVIFITGLDSTEDEEKGLRLGAVDYITKPFNNSIVKARVKTHLQIIEYIRTIDRLCKVDALTNIANRRSFDAYSAVEWERGIRENQPIGFLMIDIDHFKKYNDTYGHPQGDILLKTVAAVFAKSLNRPADFVARWGGEEFVVLLPNTDMNGALDVAERIRANTEDTIIPISGETNTRVTVSIGVNSEMPSQSNKLEDLMTKADNALYSAKNSGRNRVVAAQS